MTELEKRAIERALTSTGGNRRQAAAQLGIGLRHATLVHDDDAIAGDPEKRGCRLTRRG
jgi:hypothetical protein